MIVNARWFLRWLYCLLFALLLGAWIVVFGCSQIPDQNQFDKSCDKGDYLAQVRVSRGLLPRHILHSWIQTCHNGKRQTWEIYWTPNLIGSHLRTNGFPSKYLPRHAVIAEKRGTEAKQIIAWLNAHFEQYPYKDQYALVGPNCNTFVMWVAENNDWPVPLTVYELKSGVAEFAR